MPKSREYNQRGEHLRFPGKGKRKTKKEFYS
jgi:hypothetical protein